jgi:hypothetical protein
MNMMRLHKQNENKPVSTIVINWGGLRMVSLFRYNQVDCGLPSSALRLPGIYAVRSGLSQSALKFRLLTVAIRATVILAVSK